VTTDNNLSAANTSALHRNLIERVAIGDMLRRRARDSGSEEALVSYQDDRRVALTYREFNQQANRIARGLRARGLIQGDRVALLASNSLEFLWVTFACYKAGMVLVPINFQQAIEDVRYNLQHAQVAAVIYEAPLEQIALAASQGQDNVRLRVITGSDQNQADITLTQLMAGQDDSDIDDIIINDRDVAQLLYSSGTTSLPKGVETSHLSLYIASFSNALGLGFTRGHSHLVVLPTFHCAAMSLCVATLQTGGKLVLQAQFDPPAIIERLQSEKIQGIAMLPMMWRALLQLPGLADADFSSLTIGIYAMAPMDTNTLEALRTAFSCDFHLASGQTEFTPAACVFYDHTETEFAAGNYWGVPSLASDQAIIDEQGNEVPDGVEGEICWRGPLVMNGYLDNDEATAESRQFGWHHSGDLGFIDSKGQLMFVDRKKDMIKSGGENISSCKIEQVLLELSDVAQAAAFGVYHPHWSEAVCGAVQLIPGSELTEEAIIAHCKTKLGGFQVPKRVLLVDSFQLTGTGKVKKRDLRDAYKDLFSDP